MRDIKACRACLCTKKGTLVRINNTYRRIFESACGVVVIRKRVDLKVSVGVKIRKDMLHWLGPVSFLFGVFHVSPDDGYPYYFCVECMAHIKKILAFRRKSRRADFVLKEIMMVRNEVSSKDIAAVDRKVTNLVSSLDIWKPQNIHFYSNYKFNENGGKQFLNEAIKYVNGTISIQCYERDQISDNNLVNDIEDKYEIFDDGIEDTTVVNNEFESVEDIVKKVGVDDTISNTVEVRMEEEIDLNDVFKGLEEKFDSDDETKKLEEQKAEFNPNETYKERLKKKRQQRQKLIEEKRKLKEEQERNRVHGKTSRAIACTLSNFKIELLSLKEQISRHEEKLTLEPFKSSLFKCIICIKIFDTIQLLIEHCEEHNKSGNAMFTCDVCSLRMENEEDMACHKSEKHRYEYSCVLCKNNMYDFSDAIKHKCMQKPVKDSDTELNGMFHMLPQTQEDMRMALKETSAGIKCSVCNLSFTASSTYKTHLDKHTKRPSSKCQCDICGVYYSSVNALTSHMTNWHQYLWQCKMCNFVAPHRHRALEHLEDHKASSTSCPHCPKTPKTQSGFDFHIRKYHYKETYCHVCPLCGGAWRSHLSFYNHQMEKHKYIYLPHPPQEPNELTCVHCNIEFKSKRAFETHALSYGHEEAKDIPYACTPCKKIFDDQASLDVHISKCRIVYPIPCRICGMKVKSAPHYGSHRRKYHPENRLHRGGRLCERCGFTFFKTKWSQHICLKEQKSFECTLCVKKFLTGRSYGLHMLYTHTDYPFQCALCPEKFKRRIKGKDHILKVHQPCTPYTCSLCNRQFALLQYLKEHSTSFHGIDPTKDPKYKMKKYKRHIFVYPHMKLNVSNIDKDLIKDMTFQVRDYNEKIIVNINKNVDYDKYFIFDQSDEQDIKPDEEERKIRKRRKKGDEVPVKQKKLKVETMVIETGENLEIMEVNGKKYVTIDDVVYQVENQ